MRGKKPSTGEILQLFRTAGFDAFTPLQRKLIPVMLSGKDAVIQASVGAGSGVAHEPSTVYNPRSTYFFLPFSSGSAPSSSFLPFLITSGSAAGAASPSAATASAAAGSSSTLRAIT